MNTTGRFLSMDPLAEKYYHLSPYAYCAGDPVNLVDPDGRKIYFAKGVPEWFKEKFAATIQYMNEKGTSWIFKELQETDNVYYIDYDEEKIKEKGGLYSHGSRTIYWSPDCYVKTANGTMLFPATILAHEGAHALQHEKYGNEKYQELLDTKDKQYNNKIEREVVKKTEQYVAKRHGDINNNDKTRKDHKGKFKILTHKDYVSVFGNDIPKKVNDENNYQILIYLHCIW